MYLLKKKRQTEIRRSRQSAAGISCYLTLSPRKLQSPHSSLKAAYDRPPEEGVSIQSVPG